MWYLAGVVTGIVFSAGCGGWIEHRQGKLAIQLSDLGMRNFVFGIGVGAITVGVAWSLWTITK